MLRIALLLLNGAAVLSAAQSTGEEFCFESMSRTLLPGNTFGSQPFQVSSMSASTTQACGLQFPECFANKDVPPINPSFVFPDITCREMLRYTIPVNPTAPVPGTALSEINACPVYPIGQGLEDPCSCQLPSLATDDRNLVLRLSMNTENCCQSCSCVGDPHCTSFSGAYDNWVICNGRNPNTCELSSAQCRTRTWNGLQCVYDTSDRGINAACRPPMNTALQPTMDFYNKIYVHAPSGVQYKASIILQLGSLGNIVCLTASYGPTVGNNPARRSHDICTGKYGGQNVPLGSQSYDFVALSAMQDFLENTKIQLKVQIRNPGGASERLEVFLDDKDTSDGQIRGGFCERGFIAEKKDADLSTCTPGEDYIFKRMCWNEMLPGDVQTRCSRRGNPLSLVLEGKRRWCGGAFADNAAASDCVTNPWYKAICKKFCGDDGACIARCESRITETPNEILQELKEATAVRTPTKNPTVPPTPCPVPIASHPFPAQGGNTITTSAGPRPIADAYIYVQRQTSANVWSDPLLWFTRNQVKCGQTLEIPSTWAGNAMIPGATYRILQCQSMAGTCGEKTLRVSADVKYTHDSGVSQPLQKGFHMRLLFDKDNLICSKKKYPNCPNEYKCCIYSPANLPQWQACMRTEHADFRGNPDLPCLPVW